jgi:hypothetical protein
MVSQNPWIPAFAGMTRQRLRGNDTFWIPAQAGMTPAMLAQE